MLGREDLLNAVQLTSRRRQDHVGVLWIGGDLSDPEMMELHLKFSYNSLCCCGNFMSLMLSFHHEISTFQLVLDIITHHPEWPINVPFNWSVSVILD